MRSITKERIFSIVYFGILASCLGLTSVAASAKTGCNLLENICIPVRLNFPPASFIDRKCSENSAKRIVLPNGSCISGFDVLVAKLLASHESVVDAIQKKAENNQIGEYRFFRKEFSEILKLKPHQFHFTVSSMSPTLEREKNGWFFAGAYYYSPAVLVTRCDHPDFADMTSIDELAAAYPSPKKVDDQRSIRIGVAPSTVYDDLFRDSEPLKLADSYLQTIADAHEGYREPLGAKAIEQGLLDIDADRITTPYSNTKQALDDLITKKLDFVVSQYTLVREAASHGGYALKLFQPIVFMEPLNVATRHQYLVAPLRSALRDIQSQISSMATHFYGLDVTERSSFSQFLSPISFCPK